MQHDPSDPDHAPPECCVAAGADDEATLPRNPYGETSAATTDTARMVEIPAGRFEMGTDDDVGFPADGEGPRRTVELDAFHVDRHQVTNAEFLQFVRETGHTTDAERFGWSFVFRDFVGPEQREHVLDAADTGSWWLAVEGANWLRPEGPGSSVLDGRLKHPVVHVSWRDAVEYATWKGKRLPTEAEWECAARGGLVGKRFPWGDELHPGGEHRCNIWQGSFPDENTAEDGFRGTAPVDAFRQNEFGMCNVAGNVWEWCADWFTVDHPEGPLVNPTGPAKGEEKVIRGGSYLCHDSYCNRYRVAARSSTDPTSTTGNCGFRCALDV